MPLLWLSLAFLGGLLLGAALLPLWPVSLAAAVGLLAAAFFERRWLEKFSWYQPWREFSHLPMAVLLAAACLGIVRYQAVQGPLTENDLAWYNGRGEFRLEGVIRQPPEIINSNIHVLVSVEQLVPLTNGQPQGVPQPVNGLALAYLPLGQNWRYGDRIQLTGKLEEPALEGRLSIMIRWPVRESIPLWVLLRRV